MFLLCPPFREEGYPVSDLDWGGDAPSQVWIGVPHTRSGWGELPHPANGAGVPHPRSGWGGGTRSSLWGVSWHGVPPPSRSQVRIWGVPRVPSVSRMGYPLCQHDVVHPPRSQVRMGGTPTGTAWRELATRRAVCLLRSRWRTFLFEIKHLPVTYGVKG